MSDNSFEIVYCSSIRLKNGKTIYASSYGKKCFVLHIKKKQ